MSMMAWMTVDPLRHPWFTSASLKRKHSDSSSDDEAPVSKFAQAMDDYDAPLYMAPQAENMDGKVEGGHSDTDEHDGHRERKKRRYDLARKMAHLRIEPTNNAMATQQQSNLNRGMDAEVLSFPPPVIPRMIPSSQPISQANSTSSNASHSSYATAQSYTYAYGSLSPIPRHNLLDEYAIEEPVSPEFDANVPLAGSSAPEVRMKGSDPAWYEREKDRIVITDLDEVIEEVENEQRALEDEYKSEAEPHPDASEYADSNADYNISSVLLDHIKRRPPPMQIPNIQKQNDAGALVLFRPPPVSFFLPPETTSNRSAKDDIQVEEVDLDADNISTPLGGFEVGTVSEVEGDPMEMDIDL